MYETLFTLLIICLIYKEGRGSIKTRTRGRGDYRGKKLKSGVGYIYSEKEK